MVIAPGFEPLVRVALGLVERREALRDGLVDVARGYGALLAGAAACGTVLALAGVGLPAGGETYHRGSALLEYWTTTNVSSLVISTAAGTAGGLLIVIRREVLTAGVMVALALVPSFALVATTALAGAWQPFTGALTRWLVDVVVVTLASAVVLAFHRAAGAGVSAPRR